VNDGDRPNPDALLAAMQTEPRGRSAGRLKVFLGMCPGVGKTYAMLEAAQREFKNGRDLVIGYVETHGRKETDALTEGLPLIPRKVSEHRGLQLTEMDLDAVLARHPQLALVDELAHTNAPGSRHPKRWQDVNELLDAGIDVFTTLNVQHHRKPRRHGAPDHRHGNSRNSFRQHSRRRGNRTGGFAAGGTDGAFAAGQGLSARTRRQRGAEFFPRSQSDRFARTVTAAGGRPRRRRTRRNFTAPKRRGAWKTGHRLMVAVSASPLSESLIRWTRRMADSLKCPWLAVHVENARPLDELAQSRLEKNLALARTLGAEVIDTADENLARGLLRIARQNNVSQIIVGKPAAGSLLGVVSRRKTTARADARKRRH
jgi:two-component system sensor histidine kinase KdpD